MVLINELWKKRTLVIDKRIEFLGGTSSQYIKFPS